MKTAFLFFTILVLFFTMKSNAAAPYGFKGQGQASTLYSNVVQFPNNQVTNLGGIKALVETGNNNLLTNPSFEHSTIATGWTLTAGSSALQSTAVPHGTRAITLTLSAQSLSFYQDSTLNAAAFADGVNGTTYIRAKTTMSNMYLCRRQAGVLIASTNGTNITNCVLISNSGKWGEYSIPTIFGATSNGIAIVSLTPSTAVAVAVTGTIDLDDAKLEAGSKVQSSSAVGPWTNGTCTSSWIANTVTTCKYRQVGDSLEIVYNWSTSGAPTAASLTLGMPSGFTIDTTKFPIIGTDTALDSNGNTEDSSAQFYDLKAYYISSTVIGPVVKGAAGTYVTTNAPPNATTPFTWGAGDSGDLFVRVPVTQLAGSVSTYSSSCGANCVDEFSANVSSTGVVTEETGGDWISSCTNATTPVCTFNTGIFTVAPHCWSTPLVAGFTGYENVVSSTQVSIYTISNSAVAVAGARKYFCKKQGADFIANRTIVGSFAEVVTSIGTTSPDIQSVHFGSGASCATACTTGNCTICSQVGNKITSVSFVSTGTYNINGLDGTKYICNSMGNSSVSALVSPIQLLASSTTSYVRIVFYNQTPTLVNTYSNSLTCLGVK